MLTRIIKTALRGGVDSVILIWPEGVPTKAWHDCQSRLTTEETSKVNLIPTKQFEAHSPADWMPIADLLGDRILWLPWNWVTHKRAMQSLQAMDAMPANITIPSIIAKEALSGKAFAEPSQERPDGVRVTSDFNAREAEKLLVAHSGKPLDGIYSTFNRKLCRPVVRWLSNTSITPNAVTLAGLAVAVVSAGMFAEGSYLAYVCGALMFFLSGLFDEMDGMLARVTFRESAFGTWFEGFVDNATYLLVFSGITVGLYRQLGARELLYGVALLAGCVLSVLVINLQRKQSTDPSRPNEYLGKMYGLLDGDSSNLISRVTRHIHVFLKKAVAIHYLLLFTILGGLPVFLRLAAFGSNLTWILTLYFGRRFFGRLARNT